MTRPTRPTRMTRLTRLLCAAWLMGGASLVSVPVRAADALEESLAVVRVVVESPDGTFTRAPSQAVRWGEVAKFALQLGGQQHQMELRASQLDGRLSVDVAHARDGQARGSARTELAPHQETVVMGDAGTKIRVRVTPTRVTIHARAAE